MANISRLSPGLFLFLKNKLYFINIGFLLKPKYEILKLEIHSYKCHFLTKSEGALQLCFYEIIWLCLWKSGDFENVNFSYHNRKLEKSFKSQFQKLKKHGIWFTYQNHICLTHSKQKIATFRQYQTTFLLRATKIWFSVT